MTIAVNWDIKLQNLLSTGSTEETRPNINNCLLGCKESINMIVS